MVKKYKLIKEYPGVGLTKGSILKKVGKFYYFDEEYINNENFWSEHIVESFPEFWQRVEEKDYEILEDSHNITKVKRLSDNEVFTIEDRVWHIRDHRDCGIIHEFKYNEWGTLIAIFYGDNSQRYSNSLDVLEKAPQPLFTTEDGVDMEEKEVIYCVNNYVMIGHSIVFHDFEPNPYLKYFSTIEAAKKYIEENKPRFSAKEIKQALWESNLENYQTLKNLTYFKEKLSI